MIILGREVVRERLDLDAARHVACEPFIAQSRGDATPPAVLHLDFGFDHGEVHAKGAWLRGSPTYTLKVASSSTAAARDGSLSSAGMSIVFEAATGTPLDLVNDGGLVTEIRPTAARNPLFVADAVDANALIVAVGADAPKLDLRA